MKVTVSLTVIFAIFTLSVNAQQESIRISAKIVDEEYKPIAFATVYSKVKKRGTISKKDGRFTISVTRTDTLELSSVSHQKMQISVSQILKGDSVLIMKQKTYEIDDVDVMALRWYNFKQQVMESTAKEENKEVVQVPGLPNVYKPRIELGQYAGMTNPVSILLTHFSRQNIYKRKKERWRRIYKKYEVRKADTALVLQKIAPKDSVPNSLSPTPTR